MSHKQLSKRRRAIQQLRQRHGNRRQSPEHALELIRSMPETGFDQTVELHLQLSLDTRQADQQMRTSVSLPHGTGRGLKVAVLAQGDAAKAAEEAGADRVGADDLLADIEADKLDFEKLIASQAMMPKLAKFGRILGPRGLMPNPKDGTVVNNDKDIAAAVKEFKLGRQVNYRTEKAGALVQLPLGKLSFTSEQLLENLGEALNSVVRSKPSGVKSLQFKRCYLSLTMGGSVPLDANKVLA
jgi:large subunit ribosomal protein L1